MEEVEDRTDSAHGLDKEDMVHSHYYNMYQGTVTCWGHHVLRALAEDGMEGHEGFPEGTDDDSEAEYTALAGRVHAVEHTSQCCSSWGCPLGLHPAAAVSRAVVVDTVIVSSTTEEPVGYVLEHRLNALSVSDCCTPPDGLCTSLGFGR